jgi:hypothetical protein
MSSVYVPNNGNEPATLEWVESFLAGAQRRHPGDLTPNEKEWRPLANLDMPQAEKDAEIRRRIQKTLRILSVGDDRIRVLLDWCDEHLPVDTTVYGHRKAAHDSLQNRIAAPQGWSGDIEQGRRR